MEALTDTIGLGAVGFGPFGRLWAGSGVIDVLDSQVELIGMVLWPAAVLRSPICQDALQLDTLLIKEGNHAVIEQISCRLVCVELDISHPAVGVDEGLLIDPTHSP